MSPDNGHPCARGLTAECFRADPQWAKQALAYRLLHMLCPKALTKRLPPGVRLALLAPGLDLPPGIDLPSGIVVPPGTIFPPGWELGDPWPEGVYPHPLDGAPTTPGGIVPPTYTEPWQPGPINQPGRVAPAGAFTWFYEDFDTLDPDVWTDQSTGDGTGTIVSGRLKTEVTESGKQAQFLHADTQAPPANFQWSFSFERESGTGTCYARFCDGVCQHEVYLYRTTDPTYLNAATSSYVQVFAQEGTKDDFTWVVSPTHYDFYINDAKVVDQKERGDYNYTPGWNRIRARATSVAYWDDWNVVSL